MRGQVPRLPQLPLHLLLARKEPQRLLLVPTLLYGGAHSAAQALTIRPSKSKAMLETGIRELVTRLGCRDRLAVAVSSRVNCVNL